MSQHIAQNKKPKTIAIVGGGSLANEIKRISTDDYLIDIIEHSNFDIASQQQCDQLIPHLSTYNVVVITAGIHSGDAWSMWMTNTVGPCYVVSNLNALSTNQTIIAVTSHGASWTSWPDIPISRVIYNVNKLSLSEFCKGLIQQGTSTNKITVFEPSKFQSRMSNNLGASITDMAQTILDIVSSPLHLVHVVAKKT